MYFFFFFQTKKQKMSGFHDSWSYAHLKTGAIWVACIDTYGIHNRRSSGLVTPKIDRDRPIGARDVSVFTTIFWVLGRI